MSDAFWPALAAMVVALIGAVVSIFNNRQAKAIHTAVNSTAAQMAADLKAANQRIADLSEMMPKRRTPRKPKAPPA